MSITATVAQGAHFNNIGYGAIDTPGEIESEVSFQSSCAYNLGNSNQYDWNKVIGFGDGGFSTRSARWGWRWDLTNSKVEIAPYVHDGGSIILPPSSQWIQLNLNTTIKLKIKLERSNQRYVFTYVNGGTTVSYNVGVSNSLANTYLGNCVTDLFYFGGTETAPHEMKIDYDNIITTSVCTKYRLTGEASGGVLVTGEKCDGSSYNVSLSMNQEVVTPCLKRGSLSTWDVTIAEDSLCD